MSTPLLTTDDYADLMTLMKESGPTSLEALAMCLSWSSRKVGDALVGLDLRGILVMDVKRFAGKKVKVFSLR